MPSHPGICLRASQFRSRRPNHSHPGPAAETIHRHLPGLSSTGARYDQSGTPRRFEFIGFWGYLVFLVYCMRRVNCKKCGVVVEEVPWGAGKHFSTKVYMHFPGHWARRLSWNETAEEFRTSWDSMHDAVAYLAWRLEHRILGPIRAIGVDEIQHGKGHKYQSSL